MRGGAGGGDVSGGNRLPFCPQAFELGIAERDVVVVLHRHVEFVARRGGRAEACISKVGGPHDHPAIGVLVVVVREAEVELCVEVLRLVDAHFQASRNDIVAELKNALLDFSVVSGGADIGDKRIRIAPLCFPRVHSEEHLPGGRLLAEEAVQVYADEYLDFGGACQLAPHLEIARRAEIACDGAEEAEPVGHARRSGYGAQLREKRVADLIVEEFRGHGEKASNRT